MSNNISSDLPNFSEQAQLSDIQGIATPPPSLTSSTPLPPETTRNNYDTLFDFLSNSTSWIIDIISQGCYYLFCIIKKITFIASTWISPNPSDDAPPGLINPDLCCFINSFTYILMEFPPMQSLLKDLIGKEQAQKMITTYTQHQGSAVNMVEYVQQCACLKKLIEDGRKNQGDVDDLLQAIFDTVCPNIEEAYHSATHPLHSFCFKITKVLAPHKAQAFTRTTDGVDSSTLYYDHHFRFTYIDRIDEMTWETLFETFMHTPPLTSRNTSFSFWQLEKAPKYMILTLPHLYDQVFKNEKADEDKSPKTEKIHHKNKKKRCKRKVVDVKTNRIKTNPNKIRNSFQEIKEDNKQLRQELWEIIQENEQLGKELEKIRQKNVWITQKNPQKEREFVNFLIGIIKQNAKKNHKPFQQIKEENEKIRQQLEQIIQKNIQIRKELEQIKKKTRSLSIKLNQTFSIKSKFIKNARKEVHYNIKYISIFLPGHYKTLVKRNDVWYLCDDARVQMIALDSWKFQQQKGVLFIAERDDLLQV